MNKNPLDELSWGFLYFLYGCTKNQQEWMAFTGAQFHEEIRRAALRKQEKIKKMMEENPRILCPAGYGTIE